MATRRQRAAAQQSGLGAGQIEKKRAASTTHVEKAAPGESDTTERLDA
jgi:hypothetical protein